MSNAIIATKYRIHTSSNGGINDTTTSTTTYIPPQTLAANAEYMEPNKVFFTFAPSVFSLGQINATKGGEVLLVHHFQIMEFKACLFNSVTN